MANRAETPGRKAIGPDFGGRVGHGSLAAESAISVNIKHQPPGSLREKFAGRLFVVGRELDALDQPQPRVNQLLHFLLRGRFGVDANDGFGS